MCIMKKILKYNNKMKNSMLSTFCLNTKCSLKWSKFLEFYTVNIFGILSGETSMY